MNSGHLRSRFCYFDTLLPLASCRKLDPLRTPRADISVGPFSLGKAVLCLGPAPAKAGPAPAKAGPAPAKAGGCARPARTLALRALRLRLRVHFCSCKNVRTLGGFVHTPTSSTHTRTLRVRLYVGGELAVR